MGSAAPGRGSKTNTPQDAGMADEINRILGKFDRYKKPEDPVMKKRKSKFVEAVEAEKLEQKAFSQKVSQKRKQREKDLHIPMLSLDTNERALRKIATKGLNGHCSLTSYPDNTGLRLRITYVVFAHVLSIIRCRDAFQCHQRAPKENRS